MARMLGTADIDLFEATFAGLPDCPYFMKNTELVYVSANPAMARLCGCASPAQLIGLRAADLFPAHLAHHYDAMDAGLIAGARPVTDRLEQTVEGIWLLFNRTPVVDTKGRRVGLIATAQRMRSGDPAHAVFRRLANVAEQLDLRLDQPLGLQALAAEAGVSVSQLERDFLRAFGITLTGYLHRRRIERAMAMIEQGVRITAVAYACGYADHSAFTRRFRRQTGMTPTAFRRCLKTGSPDR